ncbi:hypothetical protein BC828DRAFT_380704 [Blastocladiella britannica]|nr:hypothetical protein BC828DRAFT_380704 [Blastocladiella britannica]
MEARLLDKQGKMFERAVRDIERGIDELVRDADFDLNAELTDTAAAITERVYRAKCVLEYRADSAEKMYARVVEASEREFQVDAEALKEKMLLEVNARKRKCIEDRDADLLSFNFGDSDAPRSNGRGGAARKVARRGGDTDAASATVRGSGAQGGKKGGSARNPPQAPGLKLREDELMEDMALLNAASRGAGGGGIENFVVSGGGKKKGRGG